LTEAYFTALDAMLAGRPILSQPGKLVLGLSTGRSGSTSLTAMIATIPGSIATHENPPDLFWAPLEAQMTFHQRRFQKLLQHVPLVVDIAHWWLPSLELMRPIFPEMRCIALVRNTEDCAKSFLRIKGSGSGGLNHWAPAENGIWTPNLWDPTYPTYPVPANARTSPGAAKADMIKCYIGDYNTRLRASAAAEPERWLMVGTETLSNKETQQSIFDFLGRQGRLIERRFNETWTQDSDASPFWF